MKLSTIIFALLFITALSFPQTGTITGTVMDSLTGEPLIGANIIIEGTSIGTATDLNGRFVLKVSPGTYSLIITYIGYERKKIENIKVEPGKKIDFNVKLNPMQIVGECVTVTGHAKGQLQSINQQLSSNTITNIVSAETIRELPEDFNTEEYAYIVENNFKDAVKNPLSTFSIDVDAASYSNTRRFLMEGRLPPKDAVRVEEFINYFDYNYPLPESDLPFKIYTEYSYCPWNEDNYLVHIGIKGKELIKDENIPSSLTFLIDVSGSMSPPNKLPLLKRAFKMLVGQLKKDDKIAIVVYAGAAGLVLPSTYGSDKEKLLDAIDQLEAGGSTAGGQGIMLAYKIAKENYIKDGNNRVILATDGDFNIGITNTGELVHFLDDKKKDGIFLTVLGFGEENIKDSRLEDLADKGNGNYYYVDNMLEAKKVFVDEIGATLFTIAKDVKIQVEFNPAKIKSYRLVGYENRLLNDEDFEDDKKDAGEIGAGHTVTALYEVVPLESIEDLPGDFKLKYQEKIIKKSAAETEEILTVSIRYKKPDEDTSNLISDIITGLPVSLNKTSNNFRFSAAAAQFGMLLRDSEFKGNADFDKTKELAKNSLGEDMHGYRAEFLRLADLASGLISQ